MTHATKEKTDEEWREWTREHLVCYEVQPLQAVKDGQVVQVGFEFEIAAYVPIAGQPVATRRQAAAELQTGLTQLARRVFPAEGEVARFEIGPFRALVQLRSQTANRPEVRCTVSVYHKQNYLQSVAPGDRQRLAPLEQRLQSIGVRAGAW